MKIMKTKGLKKKMKKSTKKPIKKSIIESKAEEGNNEATECCNDRQWVTLELDEALQAKGFEQGLVGIEVLQVQNNKNKNVEYINEREMSSKMDKESEMRRKKAKLRSRKRLRAKEKKKKANNNGEQVDGEDEEQSPTNVDEDVNDEEETEHEKNDKDRESDDEENDKEKESNNEKVDEEEMTSKTVTENIEKSSEWRQLLVPELLISSLDSLNFSTPTSIQRAVLPAAIGGRLDVVGVAETGSGKTLAFGIPIITGILNDRELDEEDSQLRALVLTPTRELAVQIREHLINVSANVPYLKIALVVGGMSSEKQRRLLSQCPEIIVATPGRFWELYQEGEPHLSRIQNIKYLAIDETDRMVERGHFEELQQLLELLNSADESYKQRRQTFVFSATLSLIHQMPKHLLKKKGSKKKPLTSQEKLDSLAAMVGLKSRRKVVDLTQKTVTAATLTESMLPCSIKEKDLYLYYIIKQYPGRTIVFCNSIDCVRRLVNIFSLLLPKALGLHAQMHQKARLKSLESFSSDENGLLIATDVAARGLDIKEVQHVVHYQVPRTSESYVHRSGRTARATKDGLSVLLVDPSEYPTLKKICVTLDKSKQLPLFPVTESALNRLKEALSLAKDVDKLRHQLKKERLNKSWWAKAADEADIIISEDEEDDNNDSQREQSLKINEMKSKQLRLKMILKEQQVNSRRLQGKYPTMNGAPVKDEGSKEERLTAVQVINKERGVKRSLSTKRNNNNRKRKRGKKSKMVEAE